MKCRQCKTRFRIITGGMGNSGPPGEYFFVGLAFAVAAGYLYLTGHTAWGVIATLAAVVMVWWSNEARADAIASCPKCGYANTVFPWSL